MFTTLYRSCFEVGHAMRGVPDLPDCSKVSGILQTLPNMQAYKQAFEYTVPADVHANQAQNYVPVLLKIKIYKFFQMTNEPELILNSEHLAVNQKLMQVSMNQETWHN